jgi:hypothetical protein
MALARFSLCSALLVTTIVAMAITIALFWREIGPLRAEVRQLRAETGQLTVDDPTKIYATAVNSPPRVGNSWKWRFYLPPGHQYCLHTLTGVVGAKGFDNDNGSLSSTMMESGEYVYEIAAGKDSDGTWVLHETSQRVNPQGELQQRSGGTSSIGSHTAWLDARGGTSYNGVNKQMSKAFDPDKSVELLRLRAGTFTPTYPGTTDPAKVNVGTSTPATGAADGILIWIDEKM